MQKQILNIVICIFAALALNARAEIVVVVNADNPTDNLSKRQIIDLYMGRNLYFPSGELALRLDLAPDSNERAMFYQSTVKKSVAQVNAYWAKLLFSGRTSPPMIMQNSQQLLDTIKNNKNALGYINEEHLEEGVKVVGRLD